MTPNVVIGVRKKAIILKGRDLLTEWGPEPLPRKNGRFLQYGDMIPSGLSNRNPPRIQESWW